MHESKNKLDYTFVVGINNVNVTALRPHSIILPSCKPDRGLAWACHNRSESRSQASCKLASNLLQTKSMLAAMKKRKHSTWVKQYIGDRHRYDAYSTVLPEMKANDESIRTVISGWTSVNSVSHNACLLSTQFITFLGVKSSFFIAFFFT